MDLNNHTSFKDIDTLNMLAEIDHLPEQLHSAWQLGQSPALPEIDVLRRVVVAGMGGSAIGADLLAAYALSSCPVPVSVHRDYGLPAFAEGPETLVIASSHSGNTEETLDSFNTALETGCSLMVICTGGELEKRARANGVPVWKFRHSGQPRAAVGFSFGLLLAAFARMGLVPDPSEELEGAVNAMKAQQAGLRADVEVVKNPAKRMAGQLIGRWVNIYGSGVLAPVARRWKGQVNEIAKAGAGYEVLPEADHNALAGIENPAALLTNTMTLFLGCSSDHPRNRRRADLTRQAFLLEGLNCDAIMAPGDTPLASMWTAIHMGDYISYYLAMSYEVDPTPIQALVNFKSAMASH